MDEAKITDQPSRVQFKLWHMFVATIWVAITLATGLFPLGESEGIGILVAGMLSLGLAVIWLNAFEWLVSWQTRRWHLCLVGVSYAMFIVSMFLPAVQMFGTTYGWEIAINILNAFFDRQESVAGRIYFGCMAISNLLVLLAAPLAALLPNKHHFGALFITIFGLVCVPPLTAVFFVAGAAAGFYVWLASHIVLLAAFRIRPVLAILMTFAMIVWVGLLFRNLG